MPLIAGVSAVVGPFTLLGVAEELAIVGSTGAVVTGTTSLVVAEALEVAPPGVPGRSRVTPYEAQRETANWLVAVSKHQHHGPPPGGVASR